MTIRGTIFLAEEDSSVRNLFARILTDAGYLVIHFVSHQVALESFLNLEIKPNVFIVNWGNGSGLEVAKALREEGFHSIIITTGRVEELSAENFLLVRKPIRADDFLKIVGEMMER
ncbi:response regulator [Candidatus Microgenomates bacterium]|nr:response regulator [Candidatus Microgenomates bacterium]